MVEETKSAAAKTESAETPLKKLKKKKSRPTNCAQSNKRIRRKDWYYRDGKYFANKQCFQLYVTQEAAKTKKAQEEAAAKAAQAQSAPAATAE